MVTNGLPEDQDSEQERPVSASQERKLSRQQMIQYLVHKNDMEAQSGKPLVATELFSTDNLALKTENPPHMVMSKVRLRLILAAQDPKRTISLIQCFINYYNEEMISFKRQGRQEYLGALQALAEQSAGGGEPTVSMR